MASGNVRQAAESCLELLNIEMVQAVTRGFIETHTKHGFEGEVDKKTQDEEIRRRLESMGFEVGQRLIDRYTKERTQFEEDLDRIKFICKEFWGAIFKKHISNLKTNHRGVFVMQDDDFRWLCHFSDATGSAEFVPNYVAFPCGLIRGALANLGIQSTVQAEVHRLPACQFTVRVLSQ